MRLVRSLDFRGWALLGAAALCIVLPGVVATLGASAHAGATLEERKLPMRFSWVPCQPNCRGWVSAVGIVTADSPGDFDEFARGRQLGGATIVLDSSGGSVNDSIALGRRWRTLGILTTVGISVETHTAQGDRASVVPEAYCESMCVFLLLSGKTRYVPEAAHVRVHQIWMGDRADDAKAASYSAQDMMIVERDIGRLAKYTFDMGGAGDLLSLSLNVPPWEDLHELSREELRLTNLVTTNAVAEVLPQTDSLFPITVPPLRERREDIPLLARYFVQDFATRMRKGIDAIPAEAMNSLVNYAWPGNVRELRNVVERSVILTSGTRLQIPKDALSQPLSEPSTVLRMTDAERRHILEALNASNWVVGGPHGAATLLGLKRSTLQSRMERLGIRRRYFVN